MLRFLCPQAAAPLHIPRSGSPQTCDVVRSFAASVRPPADAALVHDFIEDPHEAERACLPLPCPAPAWDSRRRRGRRRTGNRHHHLQLGAAGRDLAGVLSADSRAGRAQCDGGARLRAGARRARDEDQAGPLAAVVHRRGGAHRSDHGDVHLAIGSRRRACSNRTSSSTWSARRSCCSSSSTGRSPSTRTSGNTVTSDHRHAALGHRRHRAQGHRRLYLLAAGATPRCASRTCRAGSTRGRRWCGTSTRPPAASQKTRVTYQTGGITWWADYNLIFNEGADANSGLLDLSAWVSIINQSGATYGDAKLKLIAGDVHRVQPRGRLSRARRDVLMKARRRAGGDGRLRAEGLLRIPPLHARPPDHAAQQLHQADRALRPGQADPGEESPAVLRRRAALLLSDARTPTGTWASP